MIPKRRRWRILTGLWSKEWHDQRWRFFLGTFVLSGLLAGEQLTAAFGDSLGDLALLEFASCLRVLVHPRPGLRQAGEAGGESWCVFAPPHTASGKSVVPPNSDFFA